MRQDIAALPQWVSLLFGSGKLAVGAAQLVLDFGGHGFAVGSYCHAGDADYLPVAVVGLLYGVRADSFQGGARSSGPTFVMSQRAIQLRAMRWLGRSPHG